MADAGLQEQVLVAGFPPHRPPEVHVATFDTAQRSITLKEAKVLEGGDITFGRETVIALADVADVDVSEGNMLAVTGRNGSVLAQLHLETVEDQRLWGKSIRAAIQSGGRATPDSGGPGSTGCPVTEDTDDEVHLLQARSRQLQTQIGQLEAANERRDQQLQNMMKRLDGAMRMLVAVQDMCGQQRRVIHAQKVAIGELARECGEPEEEEPRPAAASPRKEAPTVPAAQSRTAARAAGAADATNGDGDAEAEIASKTEQMQLLLQKAEELHRALGEMDAAGVAAAGSGAATSQQASAPVASPAARQLAAEAARGQGGSGGGGEDDEADEDEVLGRLASLEAEKEHFEGMLNDSQAEHDDLLQRLNDMRSLMSMLGMQPDNADDSNSNGSDTGQNTGVA